MIQNTLKAQIATAEKSHIVNDYYIGHTHVIICDDYCRNQTTEDVDIILKRIAQISQRNLKSNTESEVTS